MPDFMLATQFAIVTRQQLVEILEICSGSIDPELVVKTLQKVKTFERNMDEVFTPKKVSKAFDGCISRMFDSFLGSWYKKEDE